MVSVIKYLFSTLWMIGGLQWFVTHELLNMISFYSFTVPVFFIRPFSFGFDFDDTLQQPIAEYSFL